MTDQRNSMCRWTQSKQGMLYCYPDIRTLFDRYDPAAEMRVARIYVEHLIGTATMASTESYANANHKPLGVPVPRDDLIV